jgi:hypothetical protein
MVNRVLLAGAFLGLSGLIEAVPPAISETPDCMLRGQYRG